MASPPKPINHSPGLPFRDLVQYLLQPMQDYARRSGHGAKGGNGSLAPAQLKRSAIARFVARWRVEVGPDVFPLFRLLMPERDKDRSMYKIKEANMAKLFIKILGISPASEDAISIEKWKIPGPGGAAGDFTGRLFQVLKERSQVPDWGNMTIDEVNKGLDELSECSKESQQLPILAKFFRLMSAQELRWLCCIILRTLKIGATDRTFFEVWHPDALKLFNITSSLSRVCWELHDEDYRLPDAEKDISVFSCFQPQLAAFRKQGIADVVKQMGGKTFYIEEKLDGERIQLHKSGDTYKYWSRKAKDYTYLYGNSYGDSTNQEGGGLTKYLQSAFDEKVKTIVLDGEMITWNDQFDAPVGFGSLKAAAKAEKNNTNTMYDGHPFYCIFDILYLNGKSLTNHSLRTRRGILARVIKPITRRFEVVPVQEAMTEFEVEARLRECVAHASEGLVVKDPDTPYIPNDRNDSWIKVKPEYMEEFGENLDLLVIGAFWGEGKRGNRLSSFLCGLRETNVDGDEPISKFKSFARVGGGFNGPDYAQIAHITEGRWQKFDPKNPPEQFYQFAMTRSGTVIDPPDMWIAPQDSFVVQLKAASATASDQYAAKVTLRFPRYELIREDKDWTTATSLTDFIHLQAQAVHEKEEKQMKAHIRRKKAPQRTSKAVTIQGADAVGRSDVVADQVFKDMEFNVLTDSKEIKKSKVELESMIKNHGGTIVLHEGRPRFQPPEPNTLKRKRGTTPVSTRDTAPTIDPQWTPTYIIAERNAVRVASLKNRGLHDLLKPIWLQKCIEANRVIPFSPETMYYATPYTAAKLQNPGSDSDEGDQSVKLAADESDTDDEDLGKLETSKTSARKSNNDTSLSFPELEVDNDTADVQSTTDSGSDESSINQEEPESLFSRYLAFFDIPSPSVESSESHPLSDELHAWTSHGGTVTYDIHDPKISHFIMHLSSALPPSSTTTTTKARTEQGDNASDSNGGERDSEEDDDLDLDLDLRVSQKTRPAWTSRADEIRAVNALRYTAARMVDVAWVTQSIDAGTVLSESRFPVLFKRK